MQIDLHLPAISLMAHADRCEGRCSFGTIFILWSLFSFAHISALNLVYCSSQNTGADFADVTSLYQSNGLCFDQCSETYAFAIVQYQKCWCSDYIPAEITSTGSCNQDCPGYPSEKCGSSSAGLFGYIALSKSPSGTLGVADNSPSSSADAVKSSAQVVSTISSGMALSSSSPSLNQASSSISTVAPSQPPPAPFLGLIISSPIPISTSSISSLTSFLTSFVQKTLPEPSPVTVQKTVTASPSVQISIVSIVSLTSITSSTITPASSTTPSSRTSAVQSPNPTSQPILLSSTSTSTTSNTPPPPNTPPANTPPPAPLTWSATPITSVITVTGQARTLTITPTAPPEPTAQAGKSRSGGGLLSNAGKAAGLFVGVVLIIMIIAALIVALWAKRRRNMGKLAVTSNAGDYTPQRRPSRLSQMALVSGNHRSTGESMVAGIQTSDWGLSNTAEKSPTDTMTPLDRRMSYPRVVDQRLDPVALWNPLHDNGSHVSVRSFRDDQDYSRRMLRVANPDE